MSTPVSKQPGNSSELYPYPHHWHHTLFGSFNPCPRSAYACFCNPCFTCQLTDRTGDHLLSCLLTPCSLMATRTKVRATYKIDGSIIEDCCVTTWCCARPCAALQIEKELNHRNAPAKRIS